MDFGKTGFSSSETFVTMDQFNCSAAMLCVDVVLNVLVFLTVSCFLNVLETLLEKILLEI